MHTHRQTSLLPIPANTRTKAATCTEGKLLGSGLTAVIKRVVDRTAELLPTENNYTTAIACIGKCIAIG